MIYGALNLLRKLTSLFYFLFLYSWKFSFVEPSRITISFASPVSFCLFIWFISLVLILAMTGSLLSMDIDETLDYRLRYIYLHVLLNFISLSSIIFCSHICKLDTLIVFLLTENLDSCLFNGCEFFS